MEKTSIIISFYNNINFLKLVLAGFEIQTFKNFEIIIADDGSSKQNIEHLKSIISNSSMNIQHVWHEDLGFRKNKILNKAIQESKSDYLIFTDGDCIPHSEFVKEHYLNRKIYCCQAGRRVNLSKRISEKLAPAIIKNRYLENNFLLLVIDSFFRKSFEVERGFYLKSKYLRNIVNRKKRGLLGSNFSLFKDDILKINGFDERYEAPSIGEDSDIQYRLELTGVKIKSFVNTAIQYHLYHKYLERSQKNIELFSYVKISNIYYTRYGINQL
jgi:glycosyltransferase involved in cell wall biosynthesis